MRLFQNGNHAPDNRIAHPFVLTALPQQAAAWGDGGHKVVAAIAQHDLTPMAKSGASVDFEPIFFQPRWARARMPISWRSVLVGEVVGNVLDRLKCSKNRVVIGSIFVAAKMTYRGSRIESSLRHRRKPEFP